MITFNRVRKFINKYLSFAESETNGLIILIPVILVSLLVPGALKWYLKSSERDQSEQDKFLLERWITESEKKILREDTLKSPTTIFRFDPNLSSRESLIALGFKPRTAERIINYRAKGGRFKTREDLLKIYGISTERVEAVWDSILIAKRKTHKKTSITAYKKQNKPVTKRVAKIRKQDLNKTPADSLVVVRGIGPVLSRRIVKYRNQLGGFIHAGQLKEVYGLKTEVIDRIMERFTIEEGADLAPLYVNMDSIRSLAGHPYISYKLARVIVAYRKQHGSYQSLDELLNIKIMNDSTWQRLKPYLSLEEPHQVK